MSRHPFHLVIIGLGFGLTMFATGCVTPFNTELPQVAPTPQPIERAKYRLHDPFADADAGPDTFTRPPSFQEQRPEPRRTLEGRNMLEADPFLGPTLPPAVSSDYPDAVQ
ncbi:hypothetical protein [Thalassoroseus pseudoceratinae]|uniref:hypothetical protein n=1 Tax=Thalassoroseus pseudoceratinae TaxID=2713176 RepID=UPI001420F2DB|nr:hypothetical protein [Thalassoroseus pseudoceratinae]